MSGSRLVVKLNSHQNHQEDSNNNNDISHRIKLKGAQKEIRPIVVV